MTTTELNQTDLIAALEVARIATSPAYREDIGSEMDASNHELDQLHVLLCKLLNKELSDCRRENVHVHCRKCGAMYFVPEETRCPGCGNSPENAETVRAVCKTCLHPVESHDCETGHCHHGEGNGNRCSCRKFK